ncbi:MAG: hypothetical protein R2769_04595 [Saprospiraceae bacterium]
MKKIEFFESKKIEDPIQLNKVVGGYITGVIGGGTLGNGECYEDLLVDGPGGSTIVCYAKDGQAS